MIYENISNDSDITSICRSYKKYCKLEKKIGNVTKEGAIRYGMVYENQMHNLFSGSLTITK